jgi:hypothetical protein
MQLVQLFQALQLGWSILLLSASNLVAATEVSNGSDKVMAYTAEIGTGEHICEFWWPDSHYNDSCEQIVLLPKDGKMLPDWTLAFTFPDNDFVVTRPKLKPESVTEGKWIFIGGNEIASCFPFGDTPHCNIHVYQIFYPC